MRFTVTICLYLNPNNRARSLSALMAVIIQILRETLYSKHELVKLCTLVKIQYSESHTLVGGTYMLRSPESVPLYPLSPLPPVHTRKLRNSGWSKQNAGTFNSEARFHPQAFRSSIHEPNNILKAAF